jgi:hypothetical protein
MGQRLGRAVARLVGGLAVSVLALAPLGCAPAGDGGLADEGVDEGASESDVLDARGLGARFNASRSAITFAVHASRATRVELWIYAEPFGADEVAHFPMTKDASGRWSLRKTVASLRSAGAGATIYYGYRAWGPNWPYDRRVDEGLERPASSATSTPRATASTRTSCSPTRTRASSPTIR